MAVYEVPKEIRLLAEQQQEILESRFPNYEYSTHDWTEDYGYRSTNSMPHWLRLVVFKKGAVLLIISFTASFIKIEQPSRWSHRPKPDHGPIETIETIDYADPKFTDNMLSDMLEELA